MNRMRLHALNVVVAPCSWTLSRCCVTRRILTMRRLSWGSTFGFLSVLASGENLDLSLANPISHQVHNIRQVDHRTDMIGDNLDLLTDP